MNVRDMKHTDIIKAFAVGHGNLFKDRPNEKAENFIVGKEDVMNFKKETGAIKSKAISGRSFSGWAGFQDFISSFGKCSGIT